MGLHAFGHGQVSRQRRAAKRPQIHIDRDVMAQAQGLSHRLGRLQLHHMALAITKTQGMHLKALLLGHGDHGGGIQAPAEQDNGFGQRAGRHGVLSERGQVVGV